MANKIYTGDDGGTYRIRVSDDTAASGSFTATGTATSNIVAKVSKSNREFGIRPRGVRLSRLVGAAPNQATRYKFLPVATEAAYDGAAFNPNAEVTVGANTWTVVTREPEDY